MNRQAASRAEEGPWPGWGSLGRRSSGSAVLLAEPPPRRRHKVTFFTDTPLYICRSLCCCRFLWVANMDVASILSSCFLLTQTRNTGVKLVPEQPRKGETVALIPGRKADYVRCTWYQGEDPEMHQIFTYIPPSLLEQKNDSLASILNSCFLLNQAGDIPVRLAPNQPRKGKSITLTPGGQAAFAMCIWYRGQPKEIKRIFTYIPSLSEQQNGPAFTGRETAGSGCSLSIRSLDVSDSAIYTVSKVLVHGSEMGNVQIALPGGDDSSVPGGESCKPFKEQVKRGLDVGAIFGIVTGGLAAILLAGVLVYYTVRGWGQRMPQRVSNSSLPVSEKPPMV